MEELFFRNKYRISSARAKWHNYNNGTYFITICTAGREHYFGEITTAQDVVETSQCGVSTLNCGISTLNCGVSTKQMHLSKIGLFTDSCINKTHTLHTNINVPVYQIMPNHIHMIIILDNITADEDSRHIVHKVKSIEMQKIANHCGILSHTISRLKFAVTKYARQNNIPFGWQKRFYDRIIRNPEEMNRIAKYIDENIANWDVDELNASESK